MADAAKIVTASLLALLLGAVVATLTPWWVMPFVVLGVAGFAYLSVVAAMVGEVLDQAPQDGNASPGGRGSRRLPRAGRADGAVPAPGGSASDFAAAPSESQLPRSAWMEEP